MKVNKELLKGSTAMLVMRVLEGQDMYGYQIIRELERQSEEVFRLNEGTLYPILHALEKEGCLTARWEERDTARRRKYYHLTDKGRRELALRMEEFTTYSHAVQRVLGGEACAPA